MDPKTKKTLESFQSHLRIKSLLTIICYLMIAGGVFVYGFYAINRSTTIKIVNDYKKNPSSYKTEKTMINPNTNFQYNDTQIYHIEAKKAFHTDNNAAVLHDVFATGDIGNITAKKLQINEDGNHLVFTGNPVLILNKATK